MNVARDYRGRIIVSESPESRFWKKVSKTDSCWNWTECITPDRGYGQFSFGGRLQPAHRVSWKFAHGAIPMGMSVLHHCDNRKCVRPDHLFLGTAMDNTHDMLAKGREASGKNNGSKTHPECVVKGENHPFHKITEDDVRMIRARYRPGLVTLDDLSREFRLNPKTIHRIVLRERWKHVA